MFVGKHREVCADNTNGSNHKLFDAKDGNKGSVMYIGDSSASITGLKWRIWWLAPASSACYQMRTMAWGTLMFGLFILEVCLNIGHLQHRKSHHNCATRTVSTDVHWSNYPVTRPHRNSHGSTLLPGCDEMTPLIQDLEHSNVPFISLSRGRLISRDHRHDPLES